MIIWLAFLVGGAILIDGTGDTIVFLLMWSIGFSALMIEIIQIAKSRAEAELREKQK